MKNQITPIVGIYKITNLINGHCYIGQSRNIKRRWSTHKTNLKYNKHENIHLQSAWNKYGEHNFKFEVLEECSVIELNKKEKYWINIYNSNIDGYNIVTSAYYPISKKLDWDSVHQIKALLKESKLNQVQIANQFCISADTIRDINHGRGWIEDNDIYPISGERKMTRKRDKVITKLHINNKDTQILIRSNNSFGRESAILNKDDFKNYLEHYKINEIAKIYNVTPITIRRWYKRLNLQPKYSLPKQRQRYFYKVAQINPNNNTIINIYSSLRDVGRHFGNENAVAKQVRLVCIGKKETAYNYKWKYVV